MKFDDIKTALEIAYTTKIIPIVFGKKEIGKTSVVFEVFPNAKIIFNEEIELNGISLLHSMSKTTKIVIIENINEKVFNAIKHILKGGWIFGEKNDCFFVLTSSVKLLNAKEFLHLELSHPTQDEWLEWANKNTVHPKIKELVKTKELLGKITPKKIEYLSKLLNAGTPSNILDTLLLPFMDGNNELLNNIKESYSKELEFEEVITLQEKNFINRIKQTTKENLDKFNEELLNEIIFDRSIISKEKLIEYVLNIDGQKSLKILFGLLESESNFAYLEELLKDKQIRKKIDFFL